ncbi:MAG: hypothetical protein GDA68_10840 [Nitrospira sp. CR2.1]|nr:hypothetical protein [Nitrospira sp. CR2.1]
MFIYLCWLALILLTGSGCAGNRDTHELLNSLLWVQTSAEYQALSSTTYRQAGEALDRALLDRTWSAILEQTGDVANLPPAVILDLDETVLDNSAFEGRLVAQGATFSPSAWDDWVREANARAVPGALDFIAQAHSKGVAILFITNRHAGQESATRENLEKLGVPLPIDLDTVLTEGEPPFNWPSDKSSRRQYLARRFRILLLIGDDLGDFLSGARDAPEQRVRLAREHHERWGRSWFLLPNPMYGLWERSLLPSALSEEERLRATHHLVRDTH